MFYVLVICLIFCISNANGDVINNNIINVKVDRTINIATQLVKVTTRITLQNAGKVPVSTFLFALEPKTKEHLSFIGSTQMQDDEKFTLKMDGKVVPSHKDISFYNVYFNTPVKPGQTVNVDVESIFTHFLVPHPTHISQSEKQMVLYHGNHYFYSPYTTRFQLTTVKLPSNSVESYSKNVKPVAHSDNTITYGSYENIPPFALSKMAVHCENNSPFLTVTRLDRTIEVSHWGVISIEEIVDVVHTGAILKGSFSRYEFQRDQSGISSVKSFKTVLPSSASDVYYRDEIGNISTSHLRELDDSVEVELRPRFPLFGGWKTHYVLGYYVPTYEYLHNAGDQYILKIRFADHIYDDSVINEAYVKVILPEGSRNIKLKLPFPITRMSDQLHHTYLDTVGRPVVVLYKSNLVEQHIQDFEIHYEYQKLLMLQEPLLVVISLYLLFILVIIYVRLDFGLRKDVASESKVRISGFVELVRTHHDNRANLYTSFDETMNKFKHNKNLTAYQTQVKKLNADHKTETSAINDLLSKLKQEGAEVADKVADLQRFDKILKEYLQQQMVLVEKLISNKIPKQQYVDSDAAVMKKKEDVVEKMQSTLFSL